MKNKFSQEIIISAILVVLLILFLKPFGFMPDTGLMMLITGFALMFTIFTAFIWREKVRDEREGMHRLLAGRFAFLVGAGILAIGIIIESVNHMLDPWLVYALIGMMLSKIAGLIYGKTKN
jgi:hypothetical protein